MTRAPVLGRRSANSLVRYAIDSGRHRVTIDSDGKAVILPLAVDPVQAEDAALDAEIRGLMSEDGDARH